MTERIISQVKGHPVSAFYILAFVVTWLGWVPQVAYSYGYFPFNSPFLYILGGVGPMLAAWIVLRALYGKEDTQLLFGPLFQWRVSYMWYAAAILGGPAVMLAAMLLNGELGLGLKRLIPSAALLFTFLEYLVAAIPEEVAWRGFALPKLQKRYSALTSSLIVGVLWALWHLPLLFIKDSVMASYSLLPFIIEIIADSVIYTWLYNSTKGSVLIVTLFHAFLNTAGPNAGIWQTAIMVALAIVIVLVYGSSLMKATKETKEAAKATA